MDIPLISIVVPMFNEERNVIRCLESLQNQTYKNKEIIVVDDGSQDQTAELALQYADRVIFSKRKGISFAKNLGIKEAKGEFIAFTDADCVPEENWLEELLKCFFEKNIVSAGGPNLNISDAGNLSKSIDMVFNFLGKFGFRYGSRIDRFRLVKHNPGCNVMYEKEIFQKVGLFNERLITSEDEELDYRIIKNGYKIFYTPYAKVKHFRKNSLFLFCRQFYRYSIGKMQLVKLHPEASRPSFFMPSLILIIAAAFTAFSPTINFCYVVLKIILLLSISVIFIVSILLSKYTNFRLLPYYLVLLPLGFSACAIGFIRGAWKKI